MIFKKKWLIFIFFHICFIKELKSLELNIFISQEKNCLEPCNGSYQSPYSNIIEGFSKTFRDLKKNLDKNEEKNNKKNISITF